MLVEEVFALTNEHRDNGTIHAFLDTVTPASMTDVTYDGLQLLAGQMTPEDFTAAVEAPGRPPRRRTSTCSRAG